MIEAKGADPIKEDNITRSRSPARTDHLTEENLVVEIPDTGETSTAGEPTSPTEIPQHFIGGAYTRGRKKSVWHRFKQFFVRSVSA